MGEAGEGAAIVVSSVVVVAGLGGSLILPVGFLSAIGNTVNGERTPGSTYGWEPACSWEGPRWTDYLWGTMSLTSLQGM